MDSSQPPIPPHMGCNAGYLQPQEMSRFQQNNGSNGSQTPQQPMWNSPDFNDGLFDLEMPTFPTSQGYWSNPFIGQYHQFPMPNHGQFGEPPGVHVANYNLPSLPGPGPFEAAEPTPSITFPLLFQMLNKTQTSNKPSSVPSSSGNATSRDPGTNYNRPRLPETLPDPGILGVAPSSSITPPNGVWLPGTKASPSIPPSPVISEHISKAIQSSSGCSRKDKALKNLRAKRMRQKRTLVRKVSVQKAKRKRDGLPDNTPTYEEALHYFQNCEFFKNDEVLNKLQSFLPLFIPSKLEILPQTVKRTSQHGEHLFRTYHQLNTAESAQIWNSMSSELRQPWLKREDAVHGEFMYQLEKGYITF